jgi:hypothetical protein
LLLIGKNQPLFTYCCPLTAACYKKLPAACCLLPAFVSFALPKICIVFTQWVI